MKTLTVKLPMSLSTRLDRVAKLRRQTKSEVVREALESLLNGPVAARPARSALELAGDLVGCVEGPGDLSTNTQYFDGLGE